MAASSASIASPRCSAPASPQPHSPPPRRPLARKTTSPSSPCKGLHSHDGPAFFGRGSAFAPSDLSARAAHRAGAKHTAADHRRAHVLLGGCFPGALASRARFSSVSHSGHLFCNGCPESVIRLLRGADPLLVSTSHGVGHVSRSSGRCNADPAPPLDVVVLADLSLCFCRGVVSEFVVYRRLADACIRSTARDSDIPGSP